MVPSLVDNHIEYMNTSWPRLRDLRLPWVISQTEEWAVAMQRMEKDGWVESHDAVGCKDCKHLKSRGPVEYPRHYWYTPEFIMLFKLKEAK